MATISTDTDMISEQQIYLTLSRNLPNFKATSDLQPVNGGNLNHVWRIKGSDKDLIIKWAPPYIASNPDVPLSAERIHFEAKALQLFDEGNALDDLGGNTVRPPRCLHFEEELNLLIMEDIGMAPSLDEWLTDNSAATAGKKLGKFIGQLHRQTFANKQLSRRFRNLDIQQTRLEVQYNPAADYAMQSGAAGVDFNLIQSQTKTLGQQLLKEGSCLVMGDLWPPSVLVRRGEMRIIDWEFSHFGQPLQDVGHFAAHCWMQAHMAPSKELKDKFQKLWILFWKHYRASLGNRIIELKQDEVMTHAGAEILIRACGPFQEGYLYEGHKPGSRSIMQAVQKAQQFIESSQISELWTNS
ncbi:phosphotransferase [Fodinibius halophilus]|uniref:Phosphotransferase n=1 Tax=Fodinibius halophilus TaxID=1736908 RepID=A0A6M1T403_9BACT|nr:phosphotransferase [Fodinibius halophilus]NGP88819.1 phosphotransferase [Fodinibius halophilus]